MNPAVETAATEARRLRREVSQHKRRQNLERRQVKEKMQKLDRLQKDVWRRYGVRLVDEALPNTPSPRRPSDDTDQRA